MIATTRLLAAVAAAALAWGCASDCDRLCEKTNACLERLGEEAFDSCVRQCQRDMEDEASAEQVNACADCFEQSSCDEIFPPGGGTGACDDEC